MKKPVIIDNELDFEYNMYDPTTCLEYKGKLFTGTVLSENGKSYTEYTNGNEDGRSVDYFYNGQIAEDFLMQNGIFISGKSWYPNGQIKFESKTNTIWDEDGVIIRKNSSWYYKNGKLRYSKDSNGYGMYYSSQEKLAIKVIYSKGEPHINDITYYHNVLIDSYQDLLKHIYLDAEYNCSFRDLAYHYVIGWIIRLYSNGKKKESITFIESIISNSRKNLNNKLDFRIKSTEENKIHNLTILINRLKQGEFNKPNDSENQDNYSRIIFE